MRKRYILVSKLTSYILFFIFKMDYAFFRLTHSSKNMFIIKNQLSFNTTSRLFSFPSPPSTWESNFSLLSTRSSPQRLFQTVHNSVLTCHNLVVLSMDVDANTLPLPSKHTLVTVDEWPFSGRTISAAHRWALALLFHRVNRQTFIRWSLPHVNNTYTLPLSKQF